MNEQLKECNYLVEFQSIKPLYEAVEDLVLCDRLKDIFSKQRESLENSEELLVRHIGPTIHFEFLVKLIDDWEVEFVAQRHDLFARAVARVLKKRMREEIENHLDFSQCVRHINGVPPGQDVGQPQKQRVCSLLRDRVGRHRVESLLRI